MEFFEPTYLILALVALVAGFIDAVAGGGGMLTVPTLLSMGLPPHIALGTNKVAASFASSTAAITYYRKGLFAPKHWLRSFIATLIGAIAGTLIVDHISTNWLEKMLPAVILVTAIYTLLSKPHPHKNEETKLCVKTKNKQWLQGLLLGGYDGIAGPGTGAFWTVSSMALYRLNILFATGIAKAMNFTSNITSMATFALLGHINWPLGLMMGICLMIGAYIGAHSAIRFGAQFIRPIFVTIVSIMAIKLGLDAWWFA